MSNNKSPMDYFLKIDAEEIYKNTRGLVSNEKISIIMNLLRAFKRKYAKMVFDEFKKDLEQTNHDFSDLLFVLGEQVTNTDAIPNPCDEVEDMDNIKEWMLKRNG